MGLLFSQNSLDTSQLFKDLLHTVNLAAALRLAHTLQVEEVESVCEGKVNDIALARVVGAIIKDQAELLFVFQEDLIIDERIKGFC